MSSQFRFFFFTTMILALIFGFMHLFFPGVTNYSFERLHIFLFNLCSGGSIILYYSEKKKRVSYSVVIFICVSLIYALSAFFKEYKVAVACALVLALIVERVRAKNLSFIPWIWFEADKPVKDKFHQASLVCLSTGLLMSALVILNNEFYHIITDMDKLTLNVFFLGFSFPLSLITMSVMFSKISEDKTGFIILLKNIGFWAVTLGVIIFFIFILFEKLVPQVFVTTILFSAVVLIFFMFRKLAIEGQEKAFLTSGMFFLLVTAITGILYIILEFYPGYPNNFSKILLKIHAFASLYGWNISGLSIILRYNDFPIRIHSKWFISLHWVTVILLAPLGYYYKFFAVISVASYAFFLYHVFFTKGFSKPIGKNGYIS